MSSLFMSSRIISGLFPESYSLHISKHVEGIATASSAVEGISNYWVHFIPFHFVPFHACHSQDSLHDIYYCSGKSISIVGMHIRQWDSTVFNDAEVVGI